ncbi:MAG: NAD(P)/FAD-dependent oxidoreductase [Methylobacter sp.]|nr:NAD(P)/FAD-dependent oxidoreductase [Methylobacter sp.]
MKAKKSYRVAIIGGGPAGSACALALAQKGITDILIVEAGDYTKFRIGESIQPESLRLFEALDIDRAFLQEGHAPCYGSVSYWGSDKRGYNDTLMNPLGHGWRLDRVKFDRFLAMQAHARGVELLTNVQLKNSTSAVDGGFLLDLASKAEGKQSRIHADFVVDAGGTAALFSRQRGSCKISTQPLVCLAVRFAPKEAEKQEHQGLTQLESVEDGWWYGAYLPDDSLLLAFYSNAATVKSQQLLQLTRWRELLSRAVNTAKLIQNAEPLSNDILSFAAPSYCLDHLCGANWLAIGDAASCYDPITSQGIIKAIANGLSAADVITGQTDLHQFSQSIKTMYRHYLTMRSRYYDLEQRWHKSPFWIKHHSRISH